MRAFEPLELGSMAIAARIVRSATNERTADGDGVPSVALAALYEALARGQCPLIVTGYAFVEASGRSAPRQGGMTSDGHARAWKDIVAAAHRARPGARLAVQIVHGGRQSLADVVTDYVAPSPVPCGQAVPREMTENDIRGTVAAFAAAARRAKEAGFDAVQLHMAHGYLLSEFLSPHTNRRTDAFGGDPERRRRVPLDVVQRVREAVGDDYPVLVKMNASDFVPGGLAPEEAAGHAAALEAAGVDAIELSAWMADGDPDNAPSRPGDPTGRNEAYYLDQARPIREAVKGIPLGLCGGIRSLACIERLLDEEGFDFVAMSRPFIAEPDLVPRLRAGQARARCISCGRCGAQDVAPIFCPLVREGTL